MMDVGANMKVTGVEKKSMKITPERNDKGYSKSKNGGENARIVLVPDAPFDLTNVPAVTNAF